MQAVEESLAYLGRVQGGRRTRDRTGDVVMPRLAVGVDVVEISRITDSIRDFGNRFTERIFTRHEIDYANRTPETANQHLAARFAAKEAAIKAFGLAEDAVDFREIEVLRLRSGGCKLVLHGSTARAINAGGFREISVSLSHDGGYAAAVVAALGPPGRGAMRREGPNGGHGDAGRHGEGMADPRSMEDSE